MWSWVMPYIATQYFMNLIVLNLYHSIMEEECIYFIKKSDGDRRHGP